MIVCVIVSVIVCVIVGLCMIVGLPMADALTQLADKEVRKTFFRCFRLQINVFCVLLHENLQENICLFSDRLKNLFLKKGKNRSKYGSIRLLLLIQPHGGFFLCVSFTDQHVPVLTGNCRS